jgi:hypothetical protein
VVFVKLARVEMTGKALSLLEPLNKDRATFREIILSIATQRSLLELEQLMHDVSINLHIISTFLPSVTDVPGTHETQLAFWNQARFFTNGWVPDIA